MPHGPQSNLPNSGELRDSSKSTGGGGGGAEEMKTQFLKKNMTHPWLGQIAITAIGVNMYICPHFLN